MAIPNLAGKADQAKIFGLEVERVLRRFGLSIPQEEIDELYTKTSGREVDAYQKHWDRILRQHNINENPSALRALRLLEQEFFEEPVIPPQSSTPQQPIQQKKQERVEEKKYYPPYHPQPETETATNIVNRKEINTAASSNASQVETIITEEIPTNTFVPKPTVSHVTQQISGESEPTIVSGSVPQGPIIPPAASGNDQYYNNGNNNSLPNRLSRLRRNLQRVRKIPKTLTRKALQEAALTAARSALAATAEYWLPAVTIFIFVIAAVIAIIVLVVTVLNILNSGSGGSSTPIACPQQPPTDIASIKSTIKQNYNIDFMGDPGNLTFFQNFYQIVCTIGQYKYIKLIGLPTSHITIDIDSANYGNGSGYTQTDAKDRYTVFLGADTDFGSLEFATMHEFAHIIQFRNNDLEDAFCVGPFGGKLLPNGNCSLPPIHTTLATYNCRSDYISKPWIYGPPYPEECFSDMVGEFFAFDKFIDTYNGLPTDSSRMQDYSNPKNEFSAYYNFAKENIFVPLSSPQLSTTSTDTSFVPATTNTCNGKYTGSYAFTTDKKNFGDPNCDFGKGQLFSLIQSLDTGTTTIIKNVNGKQVPTTYNNSYIWENIVIPGEAAPSFNPNSFNDHAYDPGGAWGLYQMGTQNSPQAKGNGQYDQGDVNWQLQTKNAINYHKQKNTWYYWCSAIRGIYGGTCQ